MNGAALNKTLRGKVIERVRLNPFPDDRGGKAYDPEIVLRSGERLRFEVQETDGGEYGVRIVVAAKNNERRRR